MSTADDLAAAFAGESQANRKYTAFARRADEEGYPGIAKLFRAAAAAETVHALNHLDVMGGIKSTKENLAAALSGETYEFTEMYPGFIEDARAEKNTGAVTTFKNANSVEKIHGGLFQKALEEMSPGAGVDYWVCDVCGNTVEGGPLEVCPICAVTKEHFFKVD